MKNRIRLLPAFILASAVGMTAYAAGTVTATNDGNVSNGTPRWRHAGGLHGDGNYVGLLHQLNLSSDQEAKIKGIFAQAKPQLQAIRTAQRSTRDALAGTLPTDPAYAALLASAQSGVQSEEALRAQTWGLILQELTPVQVGQIPGLLAARRQAWAARKAAWYASHAAPDGE